MRKNRPLTQEEKTLWSRVIESISPLQKPKKILAKEQIQKRNMVKKATSAPSILLGSSSIKVHQNALKTQTTSLDLKEGFEKHIQRKVTRKTLKIEAVLDLHGYICEHAYEKLGTFLEKAREQEKRCLLIITGKGSGVLKQAVISWISQDLYKAGVMAYKEAPQKLGGSGALLLILRKKSKKMNL